MAKQTTPKPKAVAPAATIATALDESTHETKIEGATASAEGTPMPPAMGNEGPAEAAGEGQSSPANPEPVRLAQDDAALRAAIGATLSEAIKTYATTPVSRENSEPSLIVTGPRKGRWRIGRKFGPEPVTLRLSELTEADLKALDEDKMLTVTAVSAPY